MVPGLTDTHWSYIYDNKPEYSLRPTLVKPTGELPGGLGS